MWRDVSAVYLHRVAPSAWRKGLPEIEGVWRDFWPADRDRELAEETPSPRYQHTTTQFEDYIYFIGGQL